MARKGYARTCVGKLGHLQMELSGHISSPKVRVLSVMSGKQERGPFFLSPFLADIL